MESKFLTPTQLWQWVAGQMGNFCQRMGEEATLRVEEEKMGQSPHLSLELVEGEQEGTCLILIRVCSSQGQEEKEE